MITKLHSIIRVLFIYTINSLNAKFVDINKMSKIWAFISQSFSNFIYGIRNTCSTNLIVILEEIGFSIIEEPIF